MNFSYFLTATCAWAVKKGDYPRKRATGMLDNFDKRLNSSYEKVLSQKDISKKETSCFIEGIKLYRRGVAKIRKYLKTKNPSLLLSGHVNIVEGRKLIINRNHSKNIDKYLIKTIHEELEEQNKYEEKN